MSTTRLAASVIGISVFLCVDAALAAPLPPAGVKGALEREYIGLLPAENFHISSGKCTDCATIKQGLWYFQSELLALPKAGETVASFSPKNNRTDDVSQWAAGDAARHLEYPSLVWLGSPQIVENAEILPGGKQVKVSDGTLVDLALAPKIPTNRSYANGDTTEFFRARMVRMRGALEQRFGKPVFTARTIWPKDFALEPSKLAGAPLARPSELAALVRESGGQVPRFDTRLLWERHPGQAREWKQKPVIGIMLNGAQGDDDESLGGHFAIATGRYDKDGEWADWAVNNFYNLDSISEKGIIAATVPMDNYLMDLNSGQQFYRPSYMLVAILSNARTAIAYQGGVQRTFNHFYRHDFRYQHAAANCAGISLDVFDSLGWRIPRRGPTGQMKAIGAYAYVSATDRSMESGRKIYDYLTEEQTRLYPAVAFEAAGLDLLQLVGALPQDGRALSEYEKQLKNDVEAIVLVRIPQVPSSRAMGSSPVFSFDEYRSRVPEDRAKWKVVPVGDRPFPPALRDGAALATQESSDVPLPIAGLGACVVLGAFAFVRRRKPAKPRSNTPV